jgi:type IV secretion system protein VirD4
MSRREAPSPMSDAAVLGLVAAVGAIGLLVWVWGGVAGAVFGRGWPGVTAAQLPVIIIHLPARLADPARAWPGGVRSVLPGAAGFYSALALIAATSWGTILGAARWGPGSWRLGRAPQGAHWAAGTDLRRLRAPRAMVRSQTGRLTLGRHRGRLLRAEERHALVAFGPPQSGKSAGLAVPALLEWEGPVVASSIKTDLLAATIERRRTLGPVFVFDPFALSGMESNSWSPLSCCRDWDGALEAAWRLAGAAELDAKGVEGGDFWAVAAEQRLAPLMFAAARAGLGMDAVVRWVYGQGTRELDETIAQLTGEADGAEQVEDVHAAYDALRAFEAQADRTRTSIEATAQGLLRAYRFRRVVRSAAGSEITPDALLDQSATLYLIGDAKAAKLLRPIFLALLSEVIDRAYERATRAGGRLADPLLVCLDEAGNVAPLPNLAEIASTAPSHNIQLISIFHDLAQARSRYGRQAETVVNSHRARMLLPGVADLDTLRYFADLIGEEEARDIARTTGSTSGARTRTSSVRRRPLAAAESLRRLPERHALLLYGRMPPARIELRLWFTDRRLRRLAAP